MVTFVWRYWCSVVLCAVLCFVMLYCAIWCFRLSCGDLGCCVVLFGILVGFVAWWCSVLMVFCAVVWCSACGCSGLLFDVVLRVVAYVLLCSVVFLVLHGAMLCVRLSFVILGCYSYVVLCCVRAAPWCLWCSVWTYIVFFTAVILSHNTWTSHPFELKRLQPLTCV